MLPSTYSTNIYRKERLTVMLLMKIYQNWHRCQIDFHILKTLTKKNRNKVELMDPWSMAVNAKWRDANVKPKACSINSKKWKTECSMASQKVCSIVHPFHEFFSFFLTIIALILACLGASSPNPAMAFRLHIPSGKGSYLFLFTKTKISYLPISL